MDISKRRHALLEISPNKMGSPYKKARVNVTPKICPIPLDFERENFSYLLNNSDDFLCDDNQQNECGFIQDSSEEVVDLGKSFSLETWSRCIVDSVQRDKNYDLILKLANEKNKEEVAECRLQGVWVHTKVDPGDIVSVLAPWSESLKCFVVTNSDGLIVTNPDHLISGTSVVGSLYCARKGALQERFRGIDSDSKVMVIGSITHELFQTVLRRRLRTSEQIERASEELLRSEDAMYMLYGNKMTVDEMKAQLSPFVSNIVEFVEKYIVGGRNIQRQKGEFSGVIESIQDIEENVWVPQLGLKGKIDASLKVKPRIDSPSSEHKYMPLELKTGRASFSNEHKGQLIIYEMMLDEIGRKVDSGLLLYLREGIMKEIHATTNSKRDIITLRNELSYYLTRKQKISDKDDVNTILSKYKSMILPPPIGQYNACSRCPYNTICCIFAKQEKLPQSSEAETLRKVSEECMQHLSPKDIEYFTHWCGILTLEDQESRKGNHLKSIWTKTAEQRRDDGHAIIDLEIVGQILKAETKYLHTFGATEESSGQSTSFHDFTLTGVNPGDYVIVSTRKRIAIAAGHVYEITKSRISIHLERNLSKNYKNEKFIIDKNVFQSTNVFNYTNLGVLLEDRVESNKLRKIIVNKLKPTFSKEKLSVPKVAQAILLELNSEQRKAVAKAMKMEDYMLLKGLPGTGKTQTLVAIIRLLCLLHKSVIVTSHTHSAVDNVLQRLKQYNIKFLRLGSDSRINPALHDCSETQLTSSCKTPADLMQLYSSYNVVGVTCHGSSHSIFLHRKFDICIVDEATQVFQPTILRPLFYANKFILVGDPDQLPPVVVSKTARTIGASESLFQRLDDPDATAVLSNQYRMNKTITKLANGLTYKGNLLCANEIVMSRTIDLPNKPQMFTEFRQDKWLLRSLEKHVDLSVVMLDTKDCLQRSQEFEKSQSVDLSQQIEKTFVDDTENPKRSKFTYTNYCDAAVAFYITKALIIGGCPAKNIGIVAPYRAQVELLRKIYEDYRSHYASSKTPISARIDFEGLEVNTVDQYQGRDKDVIIYSCTRTGSAASEKGDSVRGMEILEDQRRLTVAITRSKCKLILIGDEECLKSYTPFKDLFEGIPSRCKIVLEDGQLGFMWTNVFDDLRKVFSGF